MRRGLITSETRPSSYCSALVRSSYTDPLGLDWLDNVGNFAAGFGDTVTFGGTKAVRELINYGLNGETDDMVDNCSTSYAWGGYTATAADLALGGAGVVTSIRSVTQAGKIADTATAAGRAADNARKAATAASRPAGIADNFVAEIASNGKGTVWRPPGLDRKREYCADYGVDFAISERLREVLQQHRSANRTERQAWPEIRHSHPSRT